ncbi:MAG TPA: prepilin-type N-terminal cleavage/methylation domain-containing protein [Tepidisphaeraceae bacterium]|nr:prepilin-type N-terminal cleavage/methylation domain-containing protein [Tepidisphaeraceae bacterium]
MRETKRHRRRGVGLIELLVALMICAALLTAVAMAVDASFKAYGVNESQSQLMERARLSMNRMLTYIRCTNQHLPDNDTAQTNFQNGLITQADSIRMMIDSVNGIIFRQSGTALLAVPFKITGATLTEGTPRTMLQGVNAGDFTITFEPQRSAQSIKTGGKYDQLKRASIALTVRAAAKTAVAGEEISNESITLSGSVMPRPNMW